MCPRSNLVPREECLGRFLNCARAFACVSCKKKSLHISRDRQSHQVPTGPWSPTLRTAVTRRLELHNIRVMCKPGGRWGRSSQPPPPLIFSPSSTSTRLKKVPSRTRALGHAPAGVRVTPSESPPEAPQTLARLRVTARTHRRSARILPSYIYIIKYIFI